MATDIIARGMAANASVNANAKIAELESTKLDNNQGSDNSGKVMATNASGDIIPIDMNGLTYNEETGQLEYGADPNLVLNKGIGLDDTLSKSGYAADAGAVGEISDTVTETSYNILKPLEDTEFNGLNISYNNGVFKIVGTKTAGMRASIGEISPTKDGTYIISYIDRNGNTKPSMYVTLGDTIISTYKQTDSTVLAELESDKTYSLEFYVTKGTSVDYEISLQCVYGDTVKDFKKYGKLIKKDHDLSNYNFSICGVSIDTYAGWIPAENTSYYSQSKLESVEMTWWKKLINETGLNLVMNNSWSGACASTIKGVASSGVQRCTNLDNGVSTPDIVVIGMFGANDWAYSPIGEYSFSTNLPSVEVDLTDTAQYATYESVVKTYKGAMATIFKRIHEKYPCARIYALDMYNYYRGENLDPAGKSETQNISVFNKALYDVAEWFGVSIIRCSECGINAINSVDYCVDGSTGIALHPNDNGHTLIYKKVLSALTNDFIV